MSERNVLPRILQEERMRSIFLQCLTWRRCPARDLLPWPWFATRIEWNLVEVFDEFQDALNNLAGRYLDMP